MRTTIVLALAAALFAASNVQAEQLFAEIDATFRVGALLTGPGDSVAWMFFDGDFARFDSNQVDIGIVQRAEIPADWFLNLSYRSWNWIEENPPGVSHRFDVFSRNGPVKIWSLPPEDLFTTASYGDGQFDDVQVTSYLSLPNGNSFVGTDYRFTALEFELLERKEAVDFNDPIGMIHFAVRFYGVPEPTMFVLLAMCLVSLPHRRRSQ